jgi:hypothetical protein
MRIAQFCSLINSLVINDIGKWIEGVLDERVNERVHTPLKNPESACVLD